MAVNVDINLKIMKDEFQKSLQKARNDSKDFAKQVSGDVNLIKNSFSTMYGVIGAQVLTSTASAIAGIFSSAIDEATQAEMSIKNLNIALATTGNFSQKTSQDFQDLASSIQKTTIYSDDAVMATQALLLNMTKLNKDGITEATNAAVDLAATFNIDLPQATDVVAKAINGQTRGLKALGFETKGGATDSERLKSVLESLSGIAGTASQKTGDYSSNQKQLKNSTSDLAETLGQLITKNKNVLDGQQATISVIQQLNDSLTNGKQFWIDLGASIAGAAAAVGAWTLGLSGIMAAIGTIGGAVLGFVSGPIAIFVGAVAAVGVGIYTAIQAVRNWESNLLRLKSAFYEVAAGAKDLASYLKLSDDNGDSIRKKAQAYREQADAIQLSKEASKENIDAKNAEAKADADYYNQLDQQNKRKKIEEEELRKVNATKLANEVSYNSQILAINQQTSIALQQEQNDSNLKMALAKNQFDTEALIKAQQTSQELINQKYESDKILIDATYQAEILKTKALDDEEEKRKAIRDASIKRDLENEKIASKKEIDIAKSRNQSQQQLDDLRKKQKESTYQKLATMADSSNETLAAIGKTFAVYQIGLDTYTAAMNAMASVPFPFNWGAAAAITLYGAEQGAKASGLKFADGGSPAFNGPVNGASLSGDRHQAWLNTNELVLNPAQTARTLFAISNGAQVGSSSSQTSDKLISAVETLSQTLLNQKQSIQINGREIVSVVRDEMRSGRTL